MTESETASVIADDNRRVPLHGPEAFEGMRKAGRLAAETLDFIAPYVQPGVTTDDLDRRCESFIRDHGATPAPLNYKGFPRATCISVNRVICHGIPSAQKRLQKGDILNIDITVILDGWHGDTSRMFWAGQPNVKARKLCDVTHDCLMRAIDVTKPGNTLGDIGHTIQSYAESHRFSVVRDFCGHGLGQVFHTAPTVLHYGRPRTGMTLRPGMIFTIEPMINSGKPDVKVLEDGWTAVTRDRSLSAQFEHSLGVTENGCEVFTYSPQGLDKPPYTVDT